MKLIDYEKRRFIVLVSFILLLLMLGCFVYTFCYKAINGYFLITGRVRNNNIVEIVIKSGDLNILYDNSVVYIDDKKKKFTILEVSNDVLIDKNVKYSMVLIETNVKGKANDVLQLTFNNKKHELWKIFEVIWG